ncbi:MAG: lectin like domain-containing protein [Lachnospiraceae bacterium]|nr:lectin like domain-containing protein [Lachnospiraceae bacterium]
MKVRSSRGRTGIKKRIAAGILAAAAGLTVPGCRHRENMGEIILSGEREELSQEEPSMEAQEAVPETAEKESGISIPEYFDYREIGRMPAVEDQGELGTCWAFASLMAMESTLLPKEQWNFSEDHMSRQNSFSLKQEEGGQYAMSMAYLLAWQGPVTEAEDPYGDGQSPEGLLPSKHVQEIRILEPKDYQRIKEAIYQTGGVQSSLFTRLQNSASQDRYYNQETAGYYYPGEEKPNHNVVIIGWDDHYPKENFNQQPEGDGAFICLNSWGPNFGQEGCFYVSYYDTNIGDINVLYSGITEPDYYTGIYQTDLCGWIGQVGYGTEEAYFANTYQAERGERLKAVGFYATMPGTSYQVYASAGIFSPDELELDEPLAEGTFRDAGFYTVELRKQLSLKPGEKFWVAVKIKTPKAVHPVAIEYQAPDSGADIDLSDGEGYLSADGQQWVSAERSQGCNLCLKAYTGP